MDKEKRSQLWHDFVLGMHNRSTKKIESWESWAEAGGTFYGEKYNSIYNTYLEALDRGIIYE